MNKKRYILVVGILLIGSFSLVLLNNKLANKETKLDEVKLKDEIKTNNKSFAIMIQKEDKTGYDVYEENTWPSEGYTFNNELSGCIDNYGSIIENSLSYNEDTNIITVDTGVTSSCYVYFDIKNNALGQYIIDNSISGLDKNFIGTDTLYRFSGTTGNTGINNYICLGTTSKCTSGSDNMYRIIGVEPSTGYVKVIKQTKYGLNISWHSTIGVAWPNSSAYSTMLTWYNSVSFKSMIVPHTWGITDFTSAPTTRANAISAETSTSTTAYVGMLSLSDYYLAYRENQNWRNTYSNYQSNWIHLVNNGNTSNHEWTMSRCDNVSAWSVDAVGYVGDYYMSEDSYAVRPTFFLDKTVNWKFGTGTSTDPFIVNQ